MTKTSHQNTSENFIPQNSSSSVSVQVGSLTPVTTSSSPLPAESRETKVKTQKPLQRWWQRLGLRYKAITFALALSTLPVLAVGTTAYYITGLASTKQTTQTEVEHAIEVADKVKSFMTERYTDIQVMASLDIFQDLAGSKEAQQEILNSYVEGYDFYDNIAIFDLQGDVVAQSAGYDLNNHQNRIYFQEVIKTDETIISQPLFSKSSGIFSIYIAAPIKDKATDKTIAVIRSRIPVQSLKMAINIQDSELKEYYLINEQEEVFFSSEGNYATSINSAGELVSEEQKEFEAIDIRSISPQYQQLQTDNKVDSLLSSHRIIAYSPIQTTSNLAQLNWGVVTATDRAVAFAAKRQLLQAIVLATLLTAALVAVVAALVTNRATRPILAAAIAVEQIGRGELSTRLHVEGEDEIATLGDKVNQMASQLEVFVQEQANKATQASLLAEMSSSHDFAQLDQQELFDTAVKGTKEVFQSDRVVIYRFQPDGTGQVIAESVNSGLPSALDEDIHDPCIPEEILSDYRNGRVFISSNVFEFGCEHPDHIKLMERLAIKASLGMPILNEGKLFGLLITHHCQTTYNWQPSEIKFLQQLANQLGIALDRVTLIEKTEKLAQEQRQLKEGLQIRLFELMKEVEPISRGDLTIRVRVGEDEIGTIADAYNATVANLRRIVTQVQEAAQQVAQTASSNQISVQDLSQEALLQAQEIARALDLAQEMTQSVTVVATQAQQAEAVVRQATQTVAEGDTNMSRTVDSILAIRQTVEETAEKVKRLGESSQKISTVVSLINSFAEQSNLLALNASIEAARAGAQGRGFAVVADEVQSLAQRSAEATKEIEQLVGEIQAETKEVTVAMTAGTEQVATGTKLVNETRHSLNKITTASAEINKLVEAITQATSLHQLASEAVTKTMTDVAKSADKTSKGASSVSLSFEQLQILATALQENVGRFKVK